MVAERFICWWRLIGKLIGGIKSEYTGMSSFKQCLNIVAEILRFLINTLNEINLNGLLGKLQKHILMR